MRATLNRLCLVVFLSATFPALADVEIFTPTPLPDGVPVTASKRSACFLKGETKRIDKTIDVNRIKVSGCEKGVVAPQKELTTYGVYVSGKGRSGGRGDTFDCEKVRLNSFNSRYLDTFLDEVVASTDAAGDDFESKEALCAANMLYTWAKHDAMALIGEGGSRNQPKKERSWTLGGISGAYLKSAGTRSRAARMSVGTASDMNEVILDWFSSLSYQTVDYTEERRKKGLDNTNIQYWNGYAILPTAILTGDDALFQSSRAVFENAISHVVDDGRAEDDGFLPRELQRGHKAQSYHVFALKPILGMAILSKAYSCDFVDSEWETEQIENLSEKSFEGYFFPELFSEAIERISGNKPAKQRVRNPDELSYLIAQLDPDMSRDLETYLLQVLAENGREDDELKVREYFDDGTYGANTVDRKLGGRLSEIVASVRSMQGECPFAQPSQ